MEPLIITCALVGAEVTRAENPNLPISPEEIAQSAKEARKVGASIVHLHCRNPDGSPTQKKEVFAEAMNRIKASCDVIVQVSTGGAVGMSLEERLEPLELRPEMATLTTGTVNFGDDVFMNSPKMVEETARRIQEYSIKPEIEVFEPGMIDNALRLVKKGLLTEPLHFDFVLGVAGGMGASPEGLVFLSHAIPRGSTWSVAGIGRHELPMAVMAVVMGGHVRVGFEDNIYYEKGVLATSNAQLVERIVRIAKELGRPVATPHEARKILHIGGSKP